VGRLSVLGVNHIAFRTPDPARLKSFYAELLDAEVLEGSHDPLRVGSVILVFFPSESTPPDDPDEIAFDCDAAGFARAYETARRLGVVTRDPVDPTPWSKAFLVRDPDGRRIELTYDDHAVYWRE
jgi:catechol 2,3-dioxygenase-like lactoylglutathione lyase family enzyme